MFGRYAEPYRPGDRPLVYSASKTFSATAVGLAIGEGRFGLDDRIVDLLTVAGSPTAPEEAGAEPAKRQPSRRAVDDRVAGITVHHLLSMSTGHTQDTIEAMAAHPPQQWVEAFLAIRPQQPVGSCHVYNNGASFLLGELVRRHTGEDLLDYLRPRILEPLGIDATWDTDPAGRCLGWTGLHVDVRGLAALGELLRCDGVWQGRRLLPEGWVARATSKQIPTVEPNRDWNLGYGYQVWMGREGFRLDGAYGQFAFVLPERELVVAVESAQSCTQVLVDLLWEHLPAPRGPSSTVPEERAASGGPGATVPEELVARNEPAASRRAVPEEPVAGSEGASRATVPEELVARNEPAASRRVETRQALAPVPIPPDSGLGTTWSHTGPVPQDAAMVEDGEEAGSPADLDGITATRVDGEVRFDLVAEGFPVRLATTPGQWRRQSLRLGDVDVPVAVAAGADEAGNLHARVVFTDTPHTLRLRLGADGGAAQAWKVNPLQGPSLAAMRAH